MRAQSPAPRRLEDVVRGVATTGVADAASGGHICSRRRTELLPLEFVCATIAGQRRYQRRNSLLPWVAAMLPLQFGGANIGERRC